MLKKSFITSAVASALVLGAFGFSSAAQAQIVLYTENWSEYSNGESVIDNGYRWHGATGPKNTAIVEEGSDGKKFLAVTSWGGADSLFGPMAYKSVNLDLRNNRSTTITGDIRYWQPDTSRLGTPYPSINVYGSGGVRLQFGFYNATSVFALVGGKTVTGTLEEAIDWNGWYRFTLNFNHVTNGVSFSVLQLDGLDGNVVDTIWETSGFDPFAFTDVTGYRFEVIRPGQQDDQFKDFHQTSNFGGITFTAAIPESSSTASVAALLALAGIMIVRRRRLAAGK